MARVKDPMHLDSILL